MSNEKDVLLKAINTYGKEKQINKLLEELNECIEASMGWGDVEVDE